MGAADADKHTDSNRNDDGSYELHGTLKKEMGPPYFWQSHFYNDDYESCLLHNHLASIHNVQALRYRLTLQLSAIQCVPLFTIHPFTVY